MAKNKQKDGMVTVRIRGTQRVRYDQTFEMTREDFDALREREASDPQFGRQHSDEDLGWLDLRDSDSAGDLEDVEITEVTTPNTGAAGE